MNMQVQYVKAKQAFFQKFAVSSPLRNEQVEVPKANQLNKLQLEEIFENSQEASEEEARNKHKNLQKQSNPSKIASQKEFQKKPIDKRKVERE